MADEVPTKTARDRLRAVLGAYGADPARWPERDRELAPLLQAAEPGLATPLEDARNLDAALARASRPVAPAGASVRLFASMDEAPGVVVPFAQRAAAEAGTEQRTELPGRFAALTTLAASLAFGLYLGASGQGDWLSPPLMAEESPEYMSAELDVLDGTLQLFEDHTDP